MRRGVRGLFALVRGSPVVTLLPQVLLAATQVRNDLAQFGHEHIGRCVAFLRGCAEERERGKDAEQFDRLDLPLPEVVTNR